MISLKFAIERELEFRKHFEGGEEHIQTLKDFPQTCSDSDSPLALSDSILQQREISHKRLREVAEKMAVETPKKAVIPPELAMQREFVYRSRTGMSSLMAIAPNECERSGEEMGRSGITNGRVRDLGFGGNVGMERNLDYQRHTEKPPLQSSNEFKLQKNSNSVQIHPNSIGFDLPMKNPLPNSTELAMRKPDRMSGQREFAREKWGGRGTVNGEIGRGRSDFGSSALPYMLGSCGSGRFQSASVSSSRPEGQPRSRHCGTSVRTSGPSSPLVNTRRSDFSNGEMGTTPGHGELARKRLQEREMANYGMREGGTSEKCAIGMKLTDKRDMERGFLHPRGEFGEASARQGMSPQMDQVGTKRKNLAGDFECLPSHSSYDQPPWVRQVSMYQPWISVRCDICNVPCMNEFSLHQHRQGKKHLAKCQELQRSKMGGEMIGGQMAWCDVCSVPCPDITALMLHRAGKKHVAMLRAMEAWKEGIENKIADVTLGNSWAREREKLQENELEED
ncbi:uncharacterized protein LOC143846003 [Tasmannia lanceolata]|uniref:uncharacterized protein LOC143846003 n=1 Tax=Tasmannia lanceolata TaxID=3420 RepID=UPI004063FE86